MSKSQDNDLHGMYNQIDESNYSYFYLTLKCAIYDLSDSFVLEFSFCMHKCVFFSNCNRYFFDYLESLYQRKLIIEKKTHTKCP